MPAEPTDRSIDQVIGRARAALDRLVQLGEQVNDEWQYVNDLRAVYGGRLDAVAAALRRDLPAGLLPVETAAAVDAATDEAALIRDPHQAIDWLSTLPQVVLLALGADA